MRYRDVTAVRVSGDSQLVTACDSCGAIGAKALDKLAAEPEIVGMMTARVAVLEVLSLGAEVVGVTAPISAEPDPTGTRLLRGISDCLSDFQIDVPILTSMEKNMETDMTALGVVVNGIAGDLHIGGFRPGDKVYVVGRPSVGQAVLDHQGQLLDAASIGQLLENDLVKEILPVGSTGIRQELTAMASYHGFCVKYHHTGLDLGQSCGPATAAIVVADPGAELKTDIPMALIGTLTLG